MVINLLKFLVTLLHSYGLTAQCCLRMIFQARQHRLTRSRVDQLARQWSHDIIKLVGTPYRIEGLDQLSFKEGVPYIFMSNHLSLMDIVFANDAAPSSLRFIAKKELSYYPLLGQAMRAGEYIFIDRKNLEQAKADLQLAKKKLQAGIKLWVFPEGTRSPQPEMLAFKKGAFHIAIELGAHIIPVALIGTDVITKRLRGKSQEEASEVIVRFGTPLEASHFGKDKLPELITQTRQAISGLLTRRISSADR